MATVGTLKTNILYALSDIGQNNYVDAEIWMNFKKGLRFISNELAKVDSKMGITETTITIDINTNSEALPTDFLAFANNEKGEPKVLNQTNDYSRMTPANESAVDSWARETSADVGTPSEYYLRGLTFYCHPYTKEETDVRYWYHPIKTITNDSTDMPWDDIFDEAIEQFVILSLRMRDERMNTVQLDSFLFDALKRDVMDILYRRDGIRMTPAVGFGWN